MTIKISPHKGIVDAYHVIRVRQSHHQVMMIVDDKFIVMNTPAAVKAGLALATLAGQAQNNEIVTFTYNGETLNLLPQHARQLAGALLKKADLADDFQRQIR
jgi:hypothetical protein